MAQFGKSVKVDMDWLPQMTKKFLDKQVQYDVLLEKRMRKATQMVWAVAHQKRPMITPAMAKAQGRSKRVSDPNAQEGVPVDTGALQASIIQKVSRNSKGWQGEVSTKGIPYAGAMEYGNSKIKARPFMRPAVNLTKDALKAVFNLKVEGNMSK
jgi:HK97 gp10 family phage protein